MREAGRRVLNMRHFDVQLIGGVVLHQGKIAEMKTGEGKTLVATLPAYLNALEGKGVHVVTVNDYLARRDSEWMGRIYRFLGLTVGVIQHELTDAERQVAYGCDITYGTNNEFGFDYLRDNMKFELAHYVQRGHHFAIVDEVDSILIDEARTPLIISGPGRGVDRAVLRGRPDHPAPEGGRGDARRHEGRGARGARSDGRLHRRREAQDGHADRERDGEGREDARRAGCSRAGSYDPANMPLLHHINQALRAHTLFKRDVDYMVKDGQVVIVDEFTGRLMPGRRWSDGLHQAVEAKEKVKIERENQTLATITFQNYFRKYKKLAGMTGTADTEAEEFGKIYNLDVMVIPPNRPLRRLEEPDVIYRTEEEKYDAIVTDVTEKQAEGRPVLVGTVSIEKSEKLSTMLQPARHQARGAEREVPRAGSRDRRAGRPQGRGDDRHEHGRPRHRHPARRQPRVHGAAAVPGRRAGRAAAEGRGAVRRRRGVRLLLPHRRRSTGVGRKDWERIFQHFKTQTDAEHDEVVRARRPAHRRHRAPRGAAHRQPAARPRRAARATRARRASTSRSKTT